MPSTHRPPGATLASLAAAVFGPCTSGLLEKTFWNLAVFTLCPCFKNCSDGAPGCRPRLNCPPTPTPGPLQPHRTALPAYRSLQTPENVPEDVPDEHSFLSPDWSHTDAGCWGYAESSVIWSFLSLASAGIGGLEEVRFRASWEGPSRPGPTAHRSEKGGGARIALGDGVKPRGRPGRRRCRPGKSLRKKDVLVCGC